MRAGSLLAVAALLLVAGACSQDEGKKVKVQSTDGTSKWVNDRRDGDREPPPPPCHPGCFPAGTPVATPTGPRAIETLRAGDEVLCVSTQGVAVAQAVRSTFCTTNVLAEVRTTAGVVTCTPIQPLVLVDGGCRRAGELKPGDRIRTWADGKPGEAEVTAVIETGREGEVFNLVVGDSAVFVAGGLQAKGKPPLDAEAK